MQSSILELSKRLRAREISPVELTKDCLARIEQLNPILNAFITVTADAALAQAHQAEVEIQRGDWRGPLHGIPLAVKDLIDTAGVLTTVASAHFKDRIPSQDAEVVRRLKESGAVLLGKQNLHEFAYGGSSVVSYFGPVRNPWDTARIAGGSSGGSAASVAAGLGYAAIGTDTAGSVREPAAFCGIVGLKPTYARVSAQGVIPLSVSLDHLGPIVRTVADAAILLNAIADPSVGSIPDYASGIEKDPRAFRVGIPRKFFYDELDPEIAAATDQALSIIKALTAEMREVAVVVDTDRTLQMVEAYRFHAEFAGRNPELYFPETLRRIRTGENFTDADANAARNKLALARNEVANVFKDVDVLVTPTVSIPPPVLAELLDQPDLLRPTELVMLRNTRPFNTWGIPAISLPCGFTAAGLPIGLQICAAPWQEATVLQLAHAYEQATEWHKRSPNLQ